MAERTPRFTDEQRRAIGERQRAAAAQAKYGTDYYSQGYRNQKEMGQAFLAKQRRAETAGPFATNWQQQWRNGQLYLRPTARQTGRIEEFGADWRPASEVLSPGHYAAIMRTDLRSPTASPVAQRRGAFFQQNPEADFSHWLAFKRAQRMPIDPATGMRINQAGEMWDQWGRRPGETFTSTKTGRQLFGAPWQPTAPAGPANPTDPTTDPTGPMDDEEEDDGGLNAPAWWL